MAYNRLNRQGIGGIEKHIQQQHEATDKNISEAFQDLKKLMANAKEMSTLSKSIANKIKDKGNRDISEDETVVFKSHLLSLGVSSALDDPVTRAKFASENKYYIELGKQVASVMLAIIAEGAGQMSLTDVYCTVNRARGMELISTDDLLNACYALDKMNLGLKLVKYESGLMVLQCDTYNSEKVAGHVLETVKALVTDDQGPGLTAHQLAVQGGISVSLAKQRLLSAESRGYLCRDESLQGLSFFPNKFVGSS
ncbi:Vacuolar protein-sorting-associated protein 36 [Halotydeus destructor]|nr:Vacuolar protein-sorting-associated protein 36 [Halotydeus destructor]